MIESEKELREAAERITALDAAIAKYNSIDENTAFDGLPPEDMSPEDRLVQIARYRKLVNERQKRSVVTKTFDKHLLLTMLLVRSMMKETGHLPSSPPSTFLLDLLMKPADALDATANLEEVYPLWMEKHGARRAAWIFRVQTGSVLVGYWWGKTIGLVERVIKSVRVFIGPSGG